MTTSYYLTDCILYQVFNTMLSISSKTFTENPLIKYVSIKLKIEAHLQSN